MAEVVNDDVRMQSAVDCDTCENTAEHFCTTCHDRLCSRCKQIHSKSRGTFDHNIERLTMENLSLSVELPIQQVCMSHAGSRANVGCKQCEIPVCEKCLVEEHNGHTLIDFQKLFLKKKAKLEEIYSAATDSLPRYETKLKEIQNRRTIVVENHQKVRSEIEKHYETAVAKLSSAKDDLLKETEVRKDQDIRTLQSHEICIEKYISSMNTFMSEFSNQNSEERNRFIMHAKCQSGVIVPEKFPYLPPPGIIRLTNDHLLKKNFMGDTMGSVVALTDHLRVLDASEIELIRTLSINKGAIMSLCYQQSNGKGTIWAFSNGTHAFMQYSETGEYITKVETKASNLRNKPLCVSPGNCILFRYDQATVNMLNADKIMETLMDFEPMSVGSICASSKNGILFGLVDTENERGGVFRYSMDGRRLQQITYTETWEPVFHRRDTRVYMSENINGDICISSETVVVFTADGQQRFSYSGVSELNSKPFSPVGICNDVLGNVLIADENNKVIHILDQNGKFLALMSIPELKKGAPISLAIDRNNYLYVGCSNGKIMVVRYIE